jgi:5-aminopentanamidase
MTTAPMVAIAQAPSVAGRLDANVERAVALISASAGAGAVLVILPELFLCGYDVAGIRAAPERHIVTGGDPYCERLQRACAAHKVAAVVGAAVGVPEGVANAALVIARDGTLVHLYRKVHLWGEEACAFVAGARPAVVDLAELRIGLSICFDAGFPEHMRALALAGADLIVCPAAFAAGDERRRYELYYPMRALENTVYVAVSNAVGEQGGLELFGDSRLFGPRGDELGRVRSDVGIAAAPIDRHEIERARQDLPYLRDVARAGVEPEIVTLR